MTEAQQSDRRDTGACLRDIAGVAVRRRDRKWLCLHEGDTLDTRVQLRHHDPVLLGTAKELTHSGAVLLLPLQGDGEGVRVLHVKVAHLEDGRQHGCLQGAATRNALFAVHRPALRRLVAPLPSTIGKAKASHRPPACGDVGFANTRRSACKMPTSRIASSYG